MNLFAFNPLTGDTVLRSKTYTRAGSYSRKISIDPARIPIIALLAISAILLTGHIAGAQSTGSPSYYLKRGIEHYNQAILLDPENAFAYVNRGLTLLQQGNTTGAEADFKRALAFAPALRPGIEQFLLRATQPSKDKILPIADR